MEITRPRTCNGNYTPWDLYCTPWESCGEGAYWNLLFYCRGVLTVLKSIHPRRGKKNEHLHMCVVWNNLALFQSSSSIYPDGLQSRQGLPWRPLRSGTDLENSQSHRSYPQNQINTITYWNKQRPWFCAVNCPVYGLIGPASSTPSNVPILFIQN